MDKLNNIKRFLVILASLAALLVVATITYRMQHGSVPARAVRKLPLQVDVSLQKVHFTETKQGVKRWDLSADRAEFNKSTDVSTLFGVRLIVSGAASTGDVQITAERAEYNNGTRDVQLIGSVHGQSGSAIEFSTSRLAYVAVRSQLETSEPVRFRDAGLLMEGVGMEFQTQTRKLKLMKDVSATYRPQGGR